MKSAFAVVYCVSFVVCPALHYFTTIIKKAFEIICRCRSLTESDVIKIQILYNADEHACVVQCLEAI